MELVEDMGPTAELGSTPMMFHRAPLEEEGLKQKI
jgi:hypothetical protein